MGWTGGWGGGGEGGREGEEGVLGGDLKQPRFWLKRSCNFAQLWASKRAKGVAAASWENDEIAMLS